jgi:hypothetical protein
VTGVFEKERGWADTKTKSAAVLSAQKNQYLMKKFILPVLVCFAVSSLKAYAAEGGKNEGGMAARKSSPIVHNILSDKLPARLQKSIKKDYAAYWITGLYKTQEKGKIAYHITVENPDQILRMSATPSTKWAVNATIPKLDY